VVAKDAKNRKKATLPLRVSTTERIEYHLSGKMPKTPAFKIPGNTAKMIQNDLTKARTAWIKAAKDNPDEHRRRIESDFLKIKTLEGKIDFHSLRHTTPTLLSALGVHPKIIQTIMRHSTIAMSMEVYTHFNLLNLRSLKTADRQKNLDFTTP